MLYEMLTGQRPFLRRIPFYVLAAILTAEPEWKAVPRRFENLLRHCLAKDPKERIGTSAMYSTFWAIQVPW